MAKKDAQISFLKTLKSLKFEFKRLKKVSLKKNLTPNNYQRRHKSISVVGCIFKHITTGIQDYFRVSYSIKRNFISLNYSYSKHQPVFIEKQTSVISLTDVNFFYEFTSVKLLTDVNLFYVIGVLFPYTQNILVK